MSKTYLDNRLKYHSASRVGIQEGEALLFAANKDQHTVDLSSIWSSPISHFPKNSNNYKITTDTSGATDDLINVFTNNKIISDKVSKTPFNGGYIWKNTDYPAVELYEDVLMTPVANSNGLGKLYEAYEILTIKNNKTVRLQDWVSPVAIFDSEYRRPIMGYTGKVKIRLSNTLGGELVEIQSTNKATDDDGLCWSAIRGTWEFIYYSGIVIFNADYTPSSDSWKSNFAKYISNDLQNVQVGVSASDIVDDVVKLYWTGFLYTGTYANQKQDINSLNVSGNTTIGGGLQVGRNLTAQSIELSSNNGTGGFLDFHYVDSVADFSERIVSNDLGLSVHTEPNKLRSEENKSFNIFGSLYTSKEIILSDISVRDSINYLNKVIRCLIESKEKTDTRPVKHLETYNNMTIPYNPDLLTYINNDGYIPTLDTQIIYNKSYCRISSNQTTDTTIQPGKLYCKICSGNGTANNPYRYSAVHANPNTNIENVYYEVIPIQEINVGTGIFYYPQIYIKDINNAYILAYDTVNNIFKSGVTYYKKSNNKYTQATVTIGDPIPINTYYILPSVLSTGTFDSNTIYYKRTGSGTTADPYVYTRAIAGTDYVNGTNIPVNTFYTSPILLNSSIFRENVTYYTKNNNNYYECVVHGALIPENTYYEKVDQLSYIITHMEEVYQAYEGIGDSFFYDYDITVNGNGCTITLPNTSVIGAKVTINLIPNTSVTVKVNSLGISQNFNNSDTSAFLVLVFEYSYSGYNVAPSWKILSIV